MKKNIIILNKEYEIKRYVDNDENKLFVDISIEKKRVFSLSIDIYMRTGKTEDQIAEYAITTFKNLLDNNKRFTSNKSLRTKPD